MNQEPKILLYDLEVSRDIVEGYGNRYEFRVVKTIRHQELMSFAYKWLGEKKVHYLSRHDFDKYEDFVFALWSILDEADIAIAHNGRKFDDRMANRFFIKVGLTPPAPYRSIDTLQAARAYFKFQGNSLNELGEYLEVGQKEKVTYADLEEDFMSDNPSRATLKAMEKYNKQDVVLLENVYLKLRPYIKNHPNLAIISQKPNTCVACESDHLQSRGYAVSNSAVYKRFQCQTCGKWQRTRLSDKDAGKHKSVYVNI